MEKSEKVRKNFASAQLCVLLELEMVEHTVLFATDLSSKILWSERNEAQRFADWRCGGFRSTKLSNYH